MITVTFDKNPGAKPLYTQLYEQISHLIIDGVISPGEKLPSKKKLAEHLQISVKTVENAYFQLSLEGYIHSKEKVGFFASDIKGFYTASHPERPAYVSKYKEDTYLLDIRANTTPAEMFPLSIWSRLSRECQAEQGRKLLATVPFNGIEELRVAISRYLLGFRGMKVSPDQIVIGSGTEYLYSRLTHLLGKECVIGMEDPGYTHIKKILINDGVPYRSLPVDKGGVSIKALGESDCNAVHVSPMCHFPLGITIPVQRRVELLQWVNAAPGRYIIEDDYNSEYLYQGSPVPTIYSQDVRQKVIYMNTFSKTIAPSLRVSYMVLPEKLMDRYVETTSFYSCTVSSTIQYQLAKFISEGHFERHIHRIKQYNIKQREMVIDQLSHSGLTLNLANSPVGTHYLLLLNTKKSDEVLYEELLKRGILASFVSQYCESSFPLFNHLLILNYSSITPEGMRLLIKNLKEIL